MCEGRLGTLRMLRRPATLRVLRRLVILRSFGLVGILGRRGMHAVLGRLEMRRSHWNGKKARNGSNNCVPLEGLECFEVLQCLEVWNT